MRTLFPGHYRPTEREFKDLWKDCTFAFDANVLLNLYRYKVETRNRFLSQLKKLRARLWLPYQVAREYQNNRLVVIAQQAAAYDEVTKVLNDVSHALRSGLDTYKRHAVIDTGTLATKIAVAVKEAVASLEDSRKTHPDFERGDSVRDELTELFAGSAVGDRTGEPARLEAAEKRFAKGLPPGGRDKGKGGTRQYGDAVIWLELLDHAKASKKPLIFVTDDRKNDWWQEFRGETVGPLPELVGEMAEYASVRFYMYRPDAFMRQAAAFLNEGSADEAAREVKRVRESRSKEPGTASAAQTYTLLDALRGKDLPGWHLSTSTFVEEASKTRAALAEAMAAQVAAAEREMNLAALHRLVSDSNLSAAELDASSFLAKVGAAQIAAAESEARLAALRSLAAEGRISAAELITLGRAGSNSNEPQTAPEKDDDEHKKGDGS